jgi:glycine/D-amino acid oxidase-like deaminating enzyme
MTRLWTRRSAVQTGLAAPWLLAACEQQRTMTGGFTGTSPERGHMLRDGVSNTTPSTTRTVHTVIAGGGVAGLSAARALRLQGLDDFALLELEDEAGGNSRAGSMAGISHPLGAHYLPVPSDAAPEVQDFLEELGLRQRVSGRWRYDERHLCHSPQERLFIHGAWQEGLLPTAGVGRSTLAQYAQFAKLVAQWQATGSFTIPVQNTLKTQAVIAQTAMPFVAYLDAQGLDDAYLRWYLDYCCRDDYGAGIAQVSAWAGIHYFAARHGFTAPGQEPAVQHDGGVLTWPQGNAYLTHALAQPLGERLHAGRVVLRITEAARGVTVDALNVRTQAVERWQAQRCIVALPVFIASRVVTNPPELLRQAAQRTTYASWLVANVHINAALAEQPPRAVPPDDGVVGNQAASDGEAPNLRQAAPAWDNVVYQPLEQANANGGLGYVDAMHQSTRIAPGPSVLTYYRALGTSVQARRSLLAKPWAQHRDETLADLAVAHPDIAQRATQVQITRYGHAMAVPTPLFLSQIGFKPTDILRKQLLNKEHSTLHYAPRYTPSTARLRFAHSDWSGYSVLEEAFTRGLHAALV